MRRSIASLVAAAAVLGAAVALSRPAALRATGDAAYVVSILPSLGGSPSRGNSINSSGLVAGYSSLMDSNYRHAVIWTDDGPLDLGTLGSPNKPKNSSVVWPVKNTSGVIVGISQTDAPDPWGENWSCSAFFTPATGTGYKCLGFVWENGVMQRLPTLGGTHGFASGANNHGQIVGWAENNVRDRTCTPPQIFQFRAVIWGPNGREIHELPLLPGDTSSAATAINDAGQVAGISGTCDDAIGGLTAAHAVFWDGGMVTEIPNFGGKEFNTPTAINEQGDIAGFGDHVGDLITEAFFWSKDKGFVGLGFLPGHGFSEAFGINNHRQVVGLSCTAAVTACRAFLWQDGVMLDLNQFVDLPPGIVRLTHAMDINDDGVITGRAITTSNTLPAYVARPVQPGAALVAKHRSLPPLSIPSEIAREPVEIAREIVGPFGPGRERLGR
jgi:probable HAF family extracellular repeat protein